MKCKCLLVRSNKGPGRCPQYPRRCPGRILFNFDRDIYTGICRGPFGALDPPEWPLSELASTSFSWFRVARTPEDAPKTAEDAP